jgi:hypothetical protein
MGVLGCRAGYPQEPAQGRTIAQHDPVGAAIAKKPFLGATFVHRIRSFSRRNAAQAI